MVGHRLIFWESVLNVTGLNAGLTIPFRATNNHQGAASTSAPRAIPPTPTQARLTVRLVSSRPAHRAMSSTAPSRLVQGISPAAMLAIKRAPDDPSCSHL